MTLPKPLRRFLAARRAALGAALTLAMILTGIAAPLLAPHDVDETDLGAVWDPPSAEHPLGADKLGRDILSRLIVGARVSLLVTSAVLTATFGLGVTVGMMAGWFGGRVDALLMRVADIVLAFPELIFAILIAAVLGAGITSVILALSLSWWPGVARLTRSLVLALRQEAFIEAATACGTPAGLILWRHILPNIAPPLAVRAALGVGFIVMAEATLSFLGIGVQEPVPSWGGS